ncbi:MAG TPA: hypothetical protein VGW78_05220 [Candidatus Babeliales bacterium]|nr:hypothetical protein [Candidatus Babeliales bacterium]
MSSYLALRLSSIYHTKKAQKISYTEAYYATKNKPLLGKEHNLGLQAAAIYSTISNIFHIIPRYPGADGYHILEVLGKSHLIGIRGFIFNILTYFMVTGYATYNLYKIYKTPESSKKITQSISE